MQYSRSDQFNRLVRFHRFANRVLENHPSHPMAGEAERLAVEAEAARIAVEAAANADGHGTLRDYLQPERTSTPSCIVLPANAENVSIKYGKIQALPRFHGLDSESPYIHLKEFDEVKVNIPLLSVIKQFPAYAKFLKDLCTVKRKHNVQKKAFLTEQLKSRWKDPFNVKNEFRDGTVDIQNPNDNNIFKVNVQLLKPFLELVNPEVDTTTLEDPSYG
ncbi:uncharacterized protein LOC113289835 isoform X2 [Papaver somniferum]|uniref:uncharacterized protein LOC113289835 isoform X2 n=1 Tax=Papaver somniferum TaxID=3469 RepID=UPI000E700874|nr:uncharacterized protein LOC113289835 isoform X2 [Papaver somniferum]